MAKTSPAINLDKMPQHVRAFFDSLDDTEKAHFLGFGGGARDDWDVPQFITTTVEQVISKGNSFIVLGLDRPHNILSGYGGTRATHSAAIDIVAGRVGFRATKRDGKGELNYVDPNFQLDAARVYVSQRSNVDQEFQLTPGTVGNTTPWAPRSTVALKADTLRLIARENIKLVTKTDWKNSQGGELTDAAKGIYGIDLIAMNDDTDMQPLVKGENLRGCLTEIIGVVEKLASLFDNHVQYCLEMDKVLLGHKHYSPFFGIPTSPSLDRLIPEGAKAVIDKVTNVAAQSPLLAMRMAAVQLNYIDAPAGAETTDSSTGVEKSLHILSKYNHTN